MRTPPSPTKAPRRRIAAITAALALTSLACGGDAARDESSPPPAAMRTSDDAPAASHGGQPLPARGSRAVVDPFDTGTFSGTDIWVDPVAGDDDAAGTSRETALRTVGAAWRLVPGGAPLSNGMRIMLAPGSYPVEGSVTYWEDKHGTASAPIVLEAADGPHTATFEADMNVFDVSYLYVLGVDIVREGDTFHCEQCDHVLIRDAELSGAAEPGSGSGAHETVKINQSQHVYIERSDVHGADDNAIDFVAVQHGHVIDSRIHGAIDWCMYAKGGSADIEISGNEVFDCGSGGVTAGQGTGFEFMSPPWIRYEAYGVRITGNVVHDVEGAGLGVNGGYDVLLAGNTLYRVGARSHVIEVAHGRRGCDGAVDVCAANLDAGGWGTTGEEQAMIPSRHVYVFDNIVLNPDGEQSQWQHFQIDGPLDPPVDSNVPSPSAVDDDLRIEGNIIWNGPADHPLGIVDACTDSNPTCNEALLRAENAIGTIRPELVDPEGGDYRLTDASRRELPPPVALPDFTWDDHPDVPPGVTSNADIPLGR